MTAGARRLWFRAHLALGLALGGWFALLGLTGSALVHYPEIDAWLRPQHRIVLADPARPVDLDAVLACLRARHPDRDGPWRIELPRAPDEPVRARYMRPREREGQAFAPLLVALHPATLDVLSEGFWGDDPMTWIYDLHYTLLLGPQGRTAVGIAGLAMLASLASGVALWWSARGARWRALIPRWRSGSARRVYDLHVLLGAHGAALLSVLCLTGAALALPGPTRALLERVSTVGHAAPPEARVQDDLTGGMVPREAALPVSLRTAALRGLEALGGGELRWIESSDVRAGNPIALRVHREGDPGRRFPHNRVWLHPRTGEVLGVQDLRHGSAADGLLAWLHPLHNGEAFGATGRLAALVLGALPFVLFCTGILRWARKRSARGHAERAQGGRAECRAVRGARDCPPETVRDAPGASQSTQDGAIIRG
ncbi:MAG: hypothetical protein RIS35_1975 [Pseudomonadota bacterium]|jgi:uncharacterized iron-regulated membrane protein